MHGKINICHLVFSFDAIGGLENGLINIINHSDPELFCHTICSLTLCGTIKTRVKNNHVRYIELNKKEGNDPKLPFALSKIFKRWKIDIVHLRNWPTMVEGFLGARIAGIKQIIYSEHGRHFGEIAQGKWLKYHIKKFIFTRVSVLLTVSNEVKREIQDLYRLNTKILVIRNGVDLQYFRSGQKQAIRRFHGFTENAKIMGTVSRLVPGKNLDKMIAEFSKDPGDEYFIIIGDGPERRGLERQIRDLNLKDRVILLGNREDIPELLSCLDVFVLPSKSEGLSNVVIEAMSCSLPVVAFDIGGNLELIDHCKGGSLIELNHLDQLMSSAKILMKNQPKAVEMGKYNRKKVEQQFSIELMISAYSRMYLNLMTKKTLGS